MKALKKIRIESEITTVKQAAAIVGSLSNPSKMPGRAWGIPIEYCVRGSRLRNIEGSVCQICYAGKGRYVFENVKQAQERRLEALTHPQWVEAMVFLIGRQKEPYFRWLDSGDLQGKSHLRKIFEVCRRLPHVKFWLPTRELGLIRTCKEAVPSNLVIRVSAAMIDGRAPAGFRNTSTVAGKAHREAWRALVQHSSRSNWFCPSSLQNDECGNCRACWSGEHENIVYAAS